MHTVLACMLLFFDSSLFRLNKLFIKVKNVSQNRKTKGIKLRSEFLRRILAPSPHHNQPIRVTVSCLRAINCSELLWCWQPRSPIMRPRGRDANNGLFEVIAAQTLSWGDLNTTFLPESWHKTVDNGWSHSHSEKWRNHFCTLRYSCCKSNL